MVAITIASPKGGVGKTSAVVNLALALNNIGKKVVLLDGALSTPDISFHLGIPLSHKTIHDVISGKKLKDALFKHSSGLKVLPGNINFYETESFKREKINKILRQLYSKHDFLLMDSVAGLNKESIGAIKTTKNLVVITSPELNSVVHAAKLLHCARNDKINILGAIINRAGRHKKELSIEDISSLLNIEILGIIPEDTRVSMASSDGKGIIEAYPYSKASREFKRIAHVLAAKEYKESLKDKFLYFWNA